MEFRNCGKYIKHFFLSFIILLCLDLHAQEPSGVEPNAVILKNIIKEILDQSLESSKNIRSFYLRKANDRETLLIEDGIIAYLRSKDCAAYFTDDIKQKEEGVFIEYSLEKLLVSYSKKADDYERVVELILSLKLIDLKKMEAFFSSRFEKKHTDIIDRAQLDSNLMSRNPALAGTLKRSGGLKRLIEPLLMIIGSSTVVYLFYTIRSR